MKGRRRSVPRLHHEDGDEGKREDSGESGFVVLRSGLPGDNIPESLEVIRAAVLVVEVVGVLPDVDTNDGFALGTGDGLAHEGRVLIGGGDDLELLRGSDDEPGPATAKTSEAGGFELGLEFVKAAELLVDGLGEGSGGGSAFIGTKEFPEEGMVGMTAAIVAYGATDGFRHGSEIGDEGFDRLRGKLGSALEGLVQIRHISRMMLVMMDFHRAGIDAGLEGIGRVRKIGKFVSHN